KLKDLDITLDILSETGIGKTVNSLRRHKQVGEFAKLLVKGWKKMIPKESTREKLNGTSERERESNTKSKPSKELMKNRETFSSNDKYSKTLKLAKEDKPLEMSRSSETRNRKRKKTDYEKHDNLKPHPDPDSEKYSKHKKAKMGHQDAEINGNEEKPSMSFESYLNYDVNVEKKKEHSGVKKAPKMVKTSSKEPTSKHPGTKPLKSSTSFPEQVYLIFKTLCKLDAIVFFVVFFVTILKNMPEDTEIFNAFDGCPITRRSPRTGKIFTQ
uniref:TFIIS N-terminal domain-containing protein n=1 Tax=Poecilia reticulata TaxID=8081 RepID=A0A3P9QF66_POERE